MHVEFKKAYEESLNSNGLSKVMEWVNPESRRYYLLFLGMDMFGHRIMKREWGSLDSSRHGGKTDVDFDYDPLNPAALANRIKRVARDRENHGYVLVNAFGVRVDPLLARELFEGTI
jgi:hypothetical protein